KNIAKTTLKNELPIPSRVLLSEQSNTSILYGDRFFFKLYRSPEEGSNPELEIIRTLTESTSFRSIPGYAGAIEYQKSKSESTTLGIFVDLIQNEGNAWEFTQSAIDQFFDRIITEKEELMSLYQGENLNVEAGSDIMMN